MIESSSVFWIIQFRTAQGNNQSKSEGKIRRAEIGWKFDREKHLAPSAPLRPSAKIDLPKIIVRFCYTEFHRGVTEAHGVFLENFSVVLCVTFIPLFSLTTMDTIEFTMDTIIVPIVKTIVPIVV
jgi:hypothetical protein